MTNRSKANEYIHGKGSEVTRAMSARSAEKEAAFFLPYLTKGMDVLDCGAGPGTITLGLAKHVSPGTATGIDVNPDQIAIAEEQASVQGASNTRFQIASLLDLPFEDASFDAAFTHMVIEHIDAADRAVAEIFRVLKPGGVYGARHGVATREAKYPRTPALTRIDQTKNRRWADGNGNPDYGEIQSRVMADAGFRIDQITSSTVHRGQKEWAEIVPDVDSAMNYLQQYIESEDEIQAARAEISLNINDPLAFISVIAVETVGIKPE